LSTIFNLTVNNVAPTATFNAPQTSYSGKSFVISINDPSDVSSADTSAGFTYAFDCGSGSFSAPSPSSTASCPAGVGPSKTVRGRITDKDGGVNEYAPQSRSTPRRKPIRTERSPSRASGPAGTSIR
jgi:hypothetical protein